MTSITSLDNRIVKMAAGLSEKKYRDREGAYIIEGPNAVREALENSGKARFIFLRAESASDECFGIARKADDEGLAVYEVSNAVYDKISGTQTPQGILAVMDKPCFSRDDFFSLCDNKNIIVVDKLQDPGNTGTLLRTAEAAGFGGALFIKGSGDPFSPKTVRASSGATERFPIIFAESANDALAILKGRNKRVFVTAMKGSKIYYETDLSHDAAIVVGNEGNGAEEDFINGADEIIRIPMGGKTESLNAAVASAIIMFEARRQQYDR